MTAVAVEDAWMESAFVSISLLNGSEMNSHAYIETIDFDRGEKDTEGKPLVSGGRLTAWKPEGDSSLTFEGYFLEAGNGKGLLDFLHQQTDNSQPLRFTNNRSRTKARVVVTWTNDPACTTAVQTTATTYSGRRIALANGHFTSVKESFTDGILKTTFVFKTSAFDKTGAVGQVIDDSVDGSGSAVLPAIAAYTSATTPFA